MITYDTTPSAIVVRLDGKKVGHIWPVTPSGFAYFPISRADYQGDNFPTIQAVKRSLEAA